MITASTPIVAPIIMGMRLEPDDDGDEDPAIAESLICIAANCQYNYHAEKFISSPHVV